MKKGIESEFKVGDVLEPVEYTSESGDVHLLELELELDNARLKKKNRGLLCFMSALLVFFLLVLAALWTLDRGR